MSGTVRCFWTEPSEFCRVRLRRYRYDANRKCVASRTSLESCEASVVIHERALRSAWIEDLPNGCQRSRDEFVSDDSIQWPVRCEACGIPFDDDSTKHVWAETLYTGAPDERPFVLREAPPGAMWHCSWWEASNPDGICLMVMLPDGTDWMVDDGRWVRTGDPRKPETLTIRESIRSPRYHGYVTCGQLVPCADSQT